MRASSSTSRRSPSIQKNVLVREYLGEAYVTKGKMAMAKAQLRKIEELCGGTECHEYADLAEEIEKAETKG